VLSDILLADAVHSSDGAAVVKVWEKIYEAVTDKILEEDRVFELAYLRFGEARRWLAEQVSLNPCWLVSEIGYGQGYLTMELASALKTGKVIGIDLLGAESTVNVTRWIANQIGVKERIALVTSDSAKLPFKKETFDAIVSFLALQDIRTTRDNKGVLKTVAEACRILKKNGTIALADDSFASCRPQGDQGILFDAIKYYWHGLLPSTEEITECMERNKISDVKALSYDVKERLPPKDAERELRLSAEWIRQFRVEVDFDNFWKKVSHIVREQGRVFPRVTLLLGTKA
jgi:ubiquinone/menaquinone biosynthesis C-methylase UbiE